MKLFLITLTLVASLATARSALADQPPRTITFEALVVPRLSQLAKPVRRALVNLQQANAATAQETQKLLTDREIVTEAVKRMREIANTATQARKNLHAAADKANKDIALIMAELHKRGLDKGITPPTCKVEP